MSVIREISPNMVKDRLDRKHTFRLIDVREQDEWNYCRIDGAELRPMSQIIHWICDLDPDGDYVFFCHYGIRSYRACASALAHGITNVANLAGGINAWSDAVDSRVPKY